MRHFILTTAAAVFSAFSLSGKAPADTSATLYTDTYLDTVNISKTKWINDYTLLGVNYGTTFCRMTFNPTHKQGYNFVPEYWSFTWTRYGKMFGYMPYFGFQLGLAYGHEGFRFKPDKETGSTYTMDGAESMVMDVVEVPFLAQMHLDTEYIKFLVDIGIYGGYRLNVRRNGPSLSAQEAVTFKPTDIRYDYGLQGGGGIAFMFDPVELHITALLRYSWSSIYTPDSSPSMYNQYYYRYAYPFDLTVMAGLHFQITKRRGKTSHALKKEAYDAVFGETQKKNEIDSGKDRP